MFAVVLDEEDELPHSVVVLMGGNTPQPELPDKESSLPPNRPIVKSGEVLTLNYSSSSSSLDSHTNLNFTEMKCGGVVFSSLDNQRREFFFTCFASKTERHSKERMEGSGGGKTRVCCNNSYS